MVILGGSHPRGSKILSGSAGPDINQRVEDIFEYFFIVLGMRGALDTNSFINGVFIN